jgi:hypothetical protein
LATQAGNWSALTALYPTLRRVDWAVAGEVANNSEQDRKNAETKSLFITTGIFSSGST